jgi:hypothetical protein
LIISTSFGELLFSTGIIQRERKQGLNWWNTTKLDRDERTLEDSIEDTGPRRRPSGHQRRPPDPLLRPANLAQRPTAFPFVWRNLTDLYVVFWPLIQVSLIRGLWFIIPDYITKPRPPWGIHHHTVKTRLELEFSKRD